MRDANTDRAGLVVSALLERGAGPFFVCPGARSVPLIGALAQLGVDDAVVLHDERTAGFAAVGAARAGRLPVVVTTSGTAVANLAPALLEARAERLPVVALTADRPWELHEVGANQTLDQVGLLRSVVVSQRDLPAPPDGAEDARVLQHVDHLLGEVAGLERRGPGHLNVRFRKPLEPAHRASRTVMAKRVSTPARPPADAALSAWVEDVARAERGCVVVGGLSVEERAGAARLVAALGWPTVVDVTSGLPLDQIPAGRRAGQLDPSLPAPDCVVWIGGRMTQPWVDRWLADAGARVWHLSSSSGGYDPNALGGERLVGCLAAVAARAAEHELQPSELASPFERLAPIPDVLPALSEPWVARHLVERARAGEALLLGNSMPVRDADEFARGQPEDLLVLSNRGASGIDGHLGTALGVAVASGRPTTALLGDLTLLHDVGGLAALRVTGAPIRVVVVNNGGGGIFSLLPVARHPGLLEPWVAAPHDLDLAYVADAFGVPARRHRAAETFVEAMASPPLGPELHEVRTRREDNADLHRTLRPGWAGAWSGRSS